MDMQQIKFKYMGSDSNWYFATYWIPLKDAKKLKRGTRLTLEGDDTTEWIVVEKYGIKDSSTINHDWGDLIPTDKGWKRPKK